MVGETMRRTNSCGPVRLHRRGLVGLTLAVSFVMASASAALAAAGQVKEYPIPTQNAGADGIAVGPDGALWFTEIAIGGIGRLGAGGFTSYPVPEANPHSIVTGPDGALWFTDPFDGRVGRITTGGGVTQFDMPPCPGCGPYEEGATAITSGPDGALWYARPAANAIGRVTTGGDIVEYPSAPGVDPSWITSGPDGALWFTDESGVGRITVEGVATQVWSGLSYPAAITTGPDGNLWLVGSSQDVVVRLTPAGRARTIPVHLDCDPQQIASGAGALWFTCYNLNEIGRVTTRGVVTYFPVPDHIPNYPNVMYGIVQGPGGAMWFTEYAANRIGRISTA